MVGKKLIPQISVILGIIVYLVGTTVAIILQPNYSFFHQYFSELGIGRTGTLFDITLVITGLLLLPFFPSAFFLLKPNKSAKLLLSISMVTGLIATDFLIFIGIYDISSDSKKAHRVVAGGFFILTIISLTFWFLALIVMRLHCESKFKYILVDIVLSIFIILLIIIFLIYSGVYGPVLQKLIIYTLLMYYGINSIRLSLSN